MKRLIALSICVLLTATLVFAGGAAEEDDDVVTIEYWHINTETFGRPAVRTLIDEFHEENPDVRVSEVFVDGAYTALLRNLTARVAANRPPDVAQIGYLYRYTVQDYPFVSVDELVEKFGGQDHLDQFDEGMLDLGRVGDTQIGVPYSLSNMVMYYNADLLEEAGLDPDNPPFNTWHEWREAAEALVEHTDTPVYLQFIDDNFHTDAIIRSNGGRMLKVDDDGYYRAAFNEPEGVEAIQFWADMVQEGLAENILWGDADSAFAAQDIATFATTIGYRASLQEMVGDSFDLRAAPMPSWGDKPRQLPGGGNFLSVFSQDERTQEAAWRFVQFLTSREGFTTWTKETGYVPLISEIADDPNYLKDFIDENPMQKVAIDQLKVTVPWTAYPGPNGVAAQQEVHEAIERAFAGEPAQKTLDDAAEAVNELIEGQKAPGF